MNRGSQRGYGRVWDPLTTRASRAGSPLSQITDRAVRCQITLIARFKRGTRAEGLSSYPALLNPFRPSGGFAWDTLRYLLHHVINGHSLAEPFQRHLADLLQLCVLFNCDRDTPADQYLTVLCLVAEPRREIADRADSRVVHALRKPDLPQGRVALRNADAEAEIVAVPTPCFENLLRRLAQCHGHLDCALGRFWRRQGVVEEHHHPITAVVIERPLEPCHDWPERSVVVA